MGRLILLRHGKAVGHDTGVRDQDRALTSRGRDNARAAGAALLAADVRPQIALVSPSTRTRETWVCLQEADNTLPNEPRIVDGLYEATFSELKEIVSEYASDARDVLVVGHNPSLHEAAVRFAHGIPNRLLPPRAEDVIGAMPTSAWVALSVCDFNAQDRSVLAAWRP